MQFGADGQPATGGQQYWETEGTISAVGEFVELVCPGAASAKIEIVGTFNGTLGGYGRAHSEAGWDGGRLIFRDGVGSLGTNKVAIAGTYDLEWRAVAGGYSILIRTDAWTSGSATVRISASAAPSIMFINGPVRTSLEEATRAGRAFLASAPNQQVTAGNALATILRNDTTDHIVWLLDRELASTAQGVQYRAYINPTTTLSQSGPISPLLQGAAIPAGITATYQSVPSGTNLGGASGSGLPFNFRESISALYGIKPGGAVGFTIDGSGGGLNNAATLGARFHAYYEPIT